MIQARLNDAAIALYQLFHAAGIKHGSFGGFAIGAIGGPRESKDIDCLASVSKKQAISILDGKKGFRYVDQSRDDYVLFLWSDQPERQRAVIVEIFPENFEGARFGMEEVKPVYLQVTGQTFGTQYTAHLDPLYIFKGKLRAAAARSKFHDSADLRWLEQKYNSRLRMRSGEFNLQTVGLAMKRYPELESMFIRIGIDTGAAKVNTAPIDIKSITSLQRGDVQMGLLASVDVSPFTYSTHLGTPSSLDESSGNKGKEQEVYKETPKVHVSACSWTDKNQLIYEFEYNGKRYEKKASEWTRWTTSPDGMETAPWISYVGKNTGITFWTVEESITQKQVEVDVVWVEQGKDIFYEFKYKGEKISQARSQWQMTEDTNQTSYLIYDNKSTGIRFWAYTNSVQPKKSTKH